MAGRFFDQLVESSTHRNARPKRGLTLPVSLAIHAAVLAAVILFPLMSLDTLPEPESTAVRAFFVEAVAPAPPPPPPPPPAAQPAATTARKAVKRKVEPRPEKVFVAPVDVPDEVTPAPGLETGGPFAPPGVPEGVEGGMEGGVVGGVAGGVVGGVLGGVPLATPAPIPPVPPPPPVLRGPLRVGGQIKEPAKLRHVSPSYPDIARQARVQGVVVLEAAISASGDVGNVRVLRGHPLLKDAAVSAVEQWRYTPTLLNGVAVPVLMTVTVNFQLAD